MFSLIIVRQNSSAFSFACFSQWISCCSVQNNAYLISNKVGDIIEKYLIQNKDVTKVMKMAKLGR